MYVIGKTGMGKSNLLKNMIISDIQSGNGLAVVDPHGDLAEDVLSFIPPQRINDVVYFNPADIDYPIAFNVMEHVDPKYRHLVASGLIGVFKKIWADSWGPRLEYLLRNAILALLEYPDSTLLGVTRMLVDDDYRKKVVGKVSDPVVKSFWTDEFTKYSKQFMVEAIAPIQNKVGQFLSSSLVRNIVSQSHSSIEMRDIMDNHKIFIINLAKGRIGEDYSALLGAMLITKIQLAAMGRVDTPEPERQDFYLYVDEFQNFATESFAGILSEARKYRLNLIVAHQYIGQLEETVRDAIFGNVGTIVSFRVGAADAEFLEKEFEPIFMMNDLVNLAKYDMYLKLMIDGVSGDAFSATSLPPIAVASKSDPEKIIKVSRERYTKKREVVEDKVARWSGYVKDEENGEWTKDTSAETSHGAGSGDGGFARKERSDNREMWDAVCASCGNSIKVPFQPDPSRQTYCKDCLVKVRKQVADGIKPSQPVHPAMATEAKSGPVDASIGAAESRQEALSSPTAIPVPVQPVASPAQPVPKPIAPAAERQSGPALPAQPASQPKPAYDAQKMLEFYEKKRAAEKEKVREEAAKNIVKASPADAHAGASSETKEKPASISAIKKPMPGIKELEKAASAPRPKAVKPQPSSQSRPTQAASHQPEAEDRSSAQLPKGGGEMKAGEVIKFN